MDWPSRTGRADYLSTVLTRQYTVGATAANDLCWQTIVRTDWATIQRILERLGESTVAPAMLSLLAGLNTELQALAAISQWLFVGSLFYVYTPEIFRRSATEHTDRESFRLLTAMLTIGYTVVLSSVIFGTPWTLHSTIGTLLGFLLATAATCVGYGWYFRRVLAWRDQSIADRIDVLAAFIPVPADEREEIHDGIAESGAWATIRASSLFAAVLMTCVMHIFLFGMLSVLVIGLYPLVEILVLLGVGGRTVYRWDPSRFNFEQSRLDILDIKTRLYDAVSNAGRGLKGWTSLFLCVFFGLFTQVLFFAFALGLVAGSTLSFATLVINIGIGTSFGAVLTWNTLGLGLSFLAASIYGVWYWIRILGRLPVFLDAWEVTVGRRESVDRENKVTRPVGLMLPPALALSGATLWIVFAPSGSGQLVVSVPDLVYAAVWPSTLVMMLASVWRTRKKAPQRPWSENLAIPLALLLQNGLGFVFLWLENPSAAGEEPVSFAFSRFGGFALLAVPWLFYLQDVYLWGEARESIWSYVFSGYLAGSGVVVLLLGVYGTNEQSHVFVLLAITILVGAVVLTVDEYLSNQRESDEEV